MKLMLSTGVFALLLGSLALVTCTSKVTDECTEEDKSLPSNCFESKTATAIFSVGGTVTGAFSGVVLQNNGDVEVQVSSSGDGTFTFAEIADGSSYDITVKAVTLAQNSCTVVNGTGTVQGADVTNVVVTCGPTLTLTYDGNGNAGGSAPAADTGREGDIIEVKSNTASLTRTNYGFDGWNTQSDGSGSYYAAGDSFTFGSSDTTLYAQWLLDIGAAPDRLDKEIGNFTTVSPSLPVAIAHASAVQVGNKMYLIGGELGSTPDPTPLGLSAGVSSAIFEATIAADGTPGAFTKSSYTLATTRQAAAVAVIGKFIYVFGGYSTTGISGTPVTSIERAPLTGNGLSGSFAAVSQTLAAGRFDPTALVTKGYVYILGGGTGSGTFHSTTVQQATVDTATGDIGNFTALTRTVITAGTEMDGGLVDSRGTHGAIRLGDNYFMLGGEGATGLNTIEKVVINPDGTLGHFVKQGYTLARTRNRVSVVALKNKAYVFGGWSTTFRPEIEVATITNDDLSAFSDVSGYSLPTPLENGAALLTAKGAFLFGGSNSSGSKSTIQRAPLQ